ncbi:hypothetical protein pipiens_012722 [Culex pipiens pipiens]|uniref:trypsin n=1 Tax=Culex pipiens pipiens TaxID=38569 RepID=A0ABD1D169_CULPP
MAKIIVLTVCALIGLTSGASLSRVFKIVGGFQVEIADFPYQVSLQRNSRHHCGGSIIDAGWILTAAHCTANKDATIYGVRVGSSEHATGGQLVSVKAVHRHPEYNSGNFEFDFSLVELGEAVEFGEGVQPIVLVEDEPSDEELSLVSGWGDTRSLEESRDFLRAVVVPMVNRTECAEANKDILPVTESMICAGYVEEGGKDACQGDSGGPLVVDGQLAGVVSWGNDCAKPGYPGVYSNVAYVRDWIREVSRV